jgi:hypothetical protein
MKVYNQTQGAIGVTLGLIWLSSIGGGDQGDPVKVSVHPKPMRGSISLVNPNMIAFVKDS